MELLASLLVGFSVFCTLLSMAGSRVRREAVLNLAGAGNIPRRRARRGKSLNTIFWYLSEWLGKLFSGSGESEVKRLLREAGLDWTVPRFMGIRRLSGLTFCLLLLPLGITGAPILPLAYIAGSRVPALWLKRRRRLALEALGADLPEVVDLVAVLCYAGESLPRSLKHSLSVVQHPQTRRELEEVVEGLQLGAGLCEALSRVVDHPSRELRRFARTVVRAEESGSPVSEVLARLAAEMRAARRERNRVRAARVSVLVLFPLVFMILPSFLLLTVGSMIIGRSL
ncbi:type II secretion system F family protein [Candidatus Solincola tengchongensis]|uniref:type II secretion system F family protein n=1 Tax=Candidatus Solincola tengchongensis TaxID=2900693 RepID=UPI00257DBDED|nr:type II secretion system F family protein [Candidatus Solincola tengchongensis]